MHHRHLTLALVLLAACGGDKGAPVAPGTPGVEAAVRDSVGISVWDYSNAAWQSAPEWQLSAEPLAVIGGAESDTTIDLSSGLVGASSGSVGRLLPDGRIVVVAGQPPEILLIDTTGQRIRTIGRQGSGPGEYRMITQLLALGGDSILAFDASQRRGVVFGLDGSMRGDRDYPTAGMLPVSPAILGVLSDGTSIHRVDGVTPTAPTGADPNRFQIPLAIVSLITGGSQYDTLFMMPGVEMYQSSITVQGQTTAIPRQIGFGTVPILAVAPNALWFTPGNRFELQRRSTGGALLQIVRVDMPARAVTPEDESEYKRVFSDALRRLGAMVPPEILDGEIKKLGETRFAKELPALSQLVIDPTGAVWASLGWTPRDSTTHWGVFGPDGTLQGRVTLPKGTLFAAGTDRVVVRREDPETGLIRLEVWGLKR